jgi:hypothetical protein
MAALIAGCLDSTVTPVDTSADIPPPPPPAPVDDPDLWPEEPIPDGTGASGAVTVTIVDPSPWHVHAPGTPFEIQVTASGPGITGAYVLAQWVDSKGNPRGYPHVMLPDETRTLRSPHRRDR